MQKLCKIALTVPFEWLVSRENAAARIQFPFLSLVGSCLLGTFNVTAADSNPAQDENVENGTDTSFGTYKTVDGYLLGRDNVIDSACDKVENWNL